MKNNIFSLYKSYIFILQFLIIINTGCFDFSSALNKEKIIVAQKEMEIISSAVILYYQTYNKLPVNIDEIDKENYLDEKFAQFIDPWNVKLIYSKNDSEKSFKTISYGADRKEGGTCLNEDIVFSQKIGE